MASCRPAPFLHKLLERFTRLMLSWANSSLRDKSLVTKNIQVTEKTRLVITLLTAVLSSGRGLAWCRRIDWISRIRQFRPLIGVHRRLSAATGILLRSLALGRHIDVGRRSDQSRLNLACPSFFGTLHQPKTTRSHRVEKESPSIERPVSSLSMKAAVPERL